MANTWKNGRMPRMRSSPVRVRLRVQAIDCCTLMVRFACVSMAALGVPVVPPVYCSTAISLSGSMATGANLPSLSSSVLSNTTLPATGDAATRARSRPLNNLNSTDLAAGSSAGNDATTARFRTPFSRRAPTLSNSTFRSSVTISSVSLSRTWNASSSMV